MQRVCTDINNPVQASHLIYCAGSFLPQYKMTKEEMTAYFVLNTR